MSDPLPPHFTACFGCGPDSAFGLHAESYLDGDQIRCSYTFDEKHAGAPGIAHGGTVAALVDDVSAFALHVARTIAVTRKLEVEYLRPVLVGVRYDLVVSVDSFEGRKLWVRCEARDPDGVLTFVGSALFLSVPPQHFHQGVGPAAL